MFHTISYVPGGNRWISEPSTVVRLTRILKTYSIPHDFLVNDTVDGRIPAPALYGKYPIIYKVLYIPGGCLGFFPSTVVTHQPDMSGSPHACPQKILEETSIR